MLNQGNSSALLRLAMMMAQATVFVPGLGFVPSPTNGFSRPAYASNGARASSSRRRRTSKKLHHRQKR